MQFSLERIGIESDENDIIDLDDFKIGYFVGKKWQSETTNDDALVIAQNKDEILLCIADGAGGHPKGDEAAKLAVLEMKEAFLKNENFLEAIEKVNDKINAFRAQAHSTLIFAHIKGDYIRFFSVGDSEVLYWNAVGSLLYNNVPQSMVGHAVEAGLISQEDSLGHENRHIVHNMLGDPSIRIEVTTRFELKKGHSIILGSDGLFDNLDHQELEAICSRGQFQDVFSELTDYALKRSQDEEWIKDDDISFIFLRRIKNNKEVE